MWKMGARPRRLGFVPANLDVTIEGEPWVLGGDILVAVNGQDVKTSEQYAKVLRQLKAKQSIDLTLFRDGTRRTLNVTLGSARRRPVPHNIPRSRCLPWFHRDWSLFHSNAV